MWMQIIAGELWESSRRDKSVVEWSLGCKVAFFRWKIEKYVTGKISSESVLTAKGIGSQ